MNHEERHIKIYYVYVIFLKLREKIAFAPVLTHSLRLILCRTQEEIFNIIHFQK